MATLRQIGDYNIVAQISEGSTTTVYKGFQQTQQRWALIKALKLEHNLNNQIVKRLRDEAHILSRLQHPNVVRLFEHGHTDHVHYLALEFIEGIDLRRLIEYGVLPPEIAWFVLRETTLGLKAAHDTNILHLDIKPSNILISYHGLVKLADFGMAELYDSVESADQLRVRGTLQYFAPEQILGEPPGNWSDIFSLGATFYEMLAGIPAFPGQSDQETFQSILNDDPIPYLRNKTDVPAELVGICDKMLARKPRDRFQDCDDLLSTINEFKKKYKLATDSKSVASLLTDPESYEPQHLQAVDTFATTPISKHKFKVSATVYGILFFFLIVLGYSGITFRESEPDLIRENSDTGTLFIPESTKKSDAQIKPTVEEPVTGQRSIPRIDERPVESANDLSKSAEPGYGSLNIICTPWAYVFLDGDSLGMTPLQKPLKLLEGTHQILLKNPRFPDWINEVDVKPGQQSVYNFSFWTTVGQLKLTVSPWARVFIDNQYLDTVPPQKKPFILAPGKHILTLKHPALGDWQTPIEIVAEKTLELQLNLHSLLLQ